jgi:hypothetical protein
MLRTPKKLVQRIMAALTSTYLASMTVERERVWVSDGGNIHNGEATLILVFAMWFFGS